MYCITWALGPSVYRDQVQSACCRAQEGTELTWAAFTVLPRCMMAPSWTSSWRVSTVVMPMLFRYHVAASEANAILRGQTTGSLDTVNKSVYDRRLRLQDIPHKLSRILTMKGDDIAPLAMVSRSHTTTWNNQKQEQR
jgi:hypothetical protein